MAAIFPDTSMQSNTPLSHCSVDNVLTEVTPLFHQTLLQVVDFADPGAVYTHRCSTRQTSQSSGLTSGELGGHISGKMKSSVSG